MGGGGREIRLVAVLLSVFFSQMQAPSQGLWVLCAKMGSKPRVVGSLCQNGCGLAHPRRGRGFRPVALCLAKLEPFYWPSDSSSTVIGLVK